MVTKKIDLFKVWPTDNYILNYYGSLKLKLWLVDNSGRSPIIYLLEY